MYNVISHQPLLPCPTTQRQPWCPSTAHIRLDVSQALSCQHAGLPTTAQLSSHWTPRRCIFLQTFSLKASQKEPFSCCFVARLGWGEALLTRACRHTHDVLGHAAIPKEDERGNAQKAILELCWEKHDLSVTYLWNFLAAPGDCSVRKQTPATSPSHSKCCRTTRCAQGSERLSWPPGFLNEPLGIYCTAF